jgi:hypothetical protein
MYNKKYRLEKVEEFGRHNPVYATMLDCVCYPAYFNVGESGLFLYATGNLFEMPHRVHTSMVEEVQYTRDNKLVVTTQNTRLTFSLFLEG